MALYLIITDGQVSGVGTAAEIDALITEGIVPASAERREATEAALAEFGL